MLCYRCFLGLSHTSMPVLSSIFEDTYLGNISYLVESTFICRNGVRKFSISFRGQHMPDCGV
jgi:hypothetical protein